jgi:hypothetical protein
MKKRVKCEKFAKNVAEAIVVAGIGSWVEGNFIIGPTIVLIGLLFFLYVDGGDN